MSKTFFNKKIIATYMQELQLICFAPPRQELGHTCHPPAPPCLLPDGSQISEWTPFKDSNNHICLIFSNLSLSSQNQAQPRLLLCRGHDWLSGWRIYTPQGNHGNCQLVAQIEKYFMNHLHSQNRKWSIVYLGCFEELFCIFLLNQRGFSSPGKE